MAVSGFKGFGWILGLATVSPACYMVSSQVAAERGRVEAVERAIWQARHDVRVLETEFDTRANMAQLERWNGDVLALSAPRPDQYVRGGTAALASLRPLGNGADGALRYASLVVPSAFQTPAPVATAELVTPAPVTPAPAPVTAVPAKAALPSPAAVQTASLTVKAAMVERASRSIVRSKMQAVAMLDDRLLGDLASSARREAARLR